MGCKHSPDPLIPSSQLLQPLGHGWHSDPKNPDAHDSQAAPVYPCGHWQVPAALHTPDPEQGGEQALDSRPEIDKEVVEPMDNWERSGTEFHRTMRLDPAFKAAHTPGASASDPAFSGTELLPTGVEGRPAKAARPE